MQNNKNLYNEEYNYFCFGKYTPLAEKSFTDMKHINYEHLDKIMINIDDIKNELSKIFTSDYVEKCMNNNQKISILSVEDELKEFTD